MQGDTCTVRPREFWTASYPLEKTMPTATDNNIEDMLCEEERRDEWKRRLEQLDRSREERRGRLYAALRKLSGLIPHEGQVLSTTSQVEFADEQMTVRRIWQDNGLSQSMEKVSQRVSDTGDRNLQVAAALLVEETKQGILRRLQQIGRRPAQRDPHDSGHVCQSEIFRHFRGLLGQPVKLEDFPEHGESVELQTKLCRSFLPPSPSSPGWPAEPSGDGCAGATDADESETACASTATFHRVSRRTGPRFDHWAFGMEAESRWHLFRRVPQDGQSHWRCQRDVRGLSRGKLQQIMQKLAEGHGFVSKTDLARLIFKAPFPDRSKYKGQVLAALSRLRAVIRANVDCSTKANPLPWDERQQGWRARIQIGYAIQEDSRLEFRMCCEMQP
jgi:hypothetical protein